MIFRRLGSLVILAIAFGVATLAGVKISEHPIPTPAPAFDASAFEQYFSHVPCAQQVALYHIDGQMIFAKVTGNCADASYSYDLFGNTPNDMLCSLSDSIAGPRTFCSTKGVPMKILFQTITSNLSKPDLGLGSGHTVEVIPFRAQ